MNVPLLGIGPVISQSTHGQGGGTVKVQIDTGLCQGHGRCYDLAPDLFGEDDEGYGMVLFDGIVAPGGERDARLAAANCPERAIKVLGEAT
jgi:ferredoxin